MFVGDATVKEAIRLSGIGRTKLYQLIKIGKLVSRTVGRKRLVSYASILNLGDDNDPVLVAA
jgi:excisionase family DNA binding protein